MNATNTGRFVWYELMTTDTKAAISFYENVVGWKTQPFKEGGDYTMWLGSQGPLGGTTTLPEQAKAMGAPPHWMANVMVDDVDATVAKVRSLDGRVLVEPSDIPEVGRFAVIADPQGASISVYKPASDMKPHDVAPGEFVWSELATDNQEGAFRFYSEIFGWKLLFNHDMGEMGTYLIFGVGDKQLGGIFNKGKHMPMPTAWLYYIDVVDLEAAVERAKAGGAKLLNGPMDVPGGARIAQLMDPQGAMFALHVQPKSAK